MIKKKLVANTIQVFKTIKLIINIDKKNFISVLIITIISGFTPVISVLLSQYLLNLIQSADKPFTYILKIFLFFSLFSLLNDFMNNLKNYFSNKLQILLGYKLNYLLMEKCSNLTMEQLEDSEVYDQITRLENDVGNKPYQSFQALTTSITALTTFISSIGIIYTWKSWTIIFIILIPLISTVYYLKIGKAEFLMRYLRGNKERESWYLSHLMTHDFAFKEIKINNLKEFFLKKYWSLKDEFINQENEIIKRQIRISTIFNVIQEISNSVILLLAIYEAFQGILLIGTVTAYIKSMGMIQSNTLILTGSLYNLYNSNMYMELLEEFLDLPEEQNEGHYKISDISSIRLENVSYSYENNIVLKNINLEFNKGDIIAIVGKNGSGKSTLLKVIAGLYKPKKGNIYVDNMKLNQVNTNSYRDRLAVLFQDFLKLEMSLSNNIALGIEEEEKDKVKINRILNKLGADFLKADNNGSYRLEALLGNWFDGGQELSGGQWQKVALARINYKQASLYLLDEPSSSLDSLSEMKIFDEFFKLVSNRVGIYITHKISIAKKSKKIIVLDNGKIVGVGTHEFLLNNCDVYKSLYEKEIAL